MKIYVATVRQCKNDKLLLEGYRNRKRDAGWKKEYVSVCIRDNHVPMSYYIGSAIDVIWDSDNKCFREK